MNITKITYTALALTFSALTLSSCDDYLDTMPDNRTTIDTEKKVANLLVSAYPHFSNMLINETMSDNADYYGDKNPNGDRFGDQVYFWKDVTEGDAESPLNLWRSCYDAIAAANQALASIEEMGGAKTTALQTSKAEALLCRAYAHFLLVNEFCMNYSKDSKALGIYYSDKVENFTDKHSRGTVAEVYARIEQDLKEALPIVTDNYTVPKYHFNKRAAYAFATRFYLYYEKWNEAVKYADLCLGSNPASTLRDWKAMGEMTSDVKAISQHYVAADVAANLMINAHASSAGVYFGPYVFFKRYAHGAYVSSNEDFGATNVWGQGGYYYQPFSSRGNNFDVVQIWKLPYLFEMKDPVSGIGIPHTVNVVFSTDEVLLNRAEAYVMLKQYDKAAADLDIWMHNIVQTDVTLTPKNIQKFYQSVPYSYDDASKMASTVKKHLHPAFAIDAEGSVQETMLQCVLGFRRMETLHQGLRWFDVKRYGIEIVRRTMGADGRPEKLTDVLKKDDPRRAVQIPLDIRQAGVEANPR